MKSTALVAALAGAWLVVSDPSVAVAGLCTSNPIKSHHNRQAEALETRAYSTKNICSSDKGACWIGKRSYNALLIACNRTRDTNGSTLDKGWPNGKSFASSLGGKYITGKYKYLGAFKKRYGYKLHRTNGTWVITSMLDFKFPKAEAKKLHIPQHLARLLSTKPGGNSIMSEGQVCGPNTKAKGRYGNGLVYVKDSEGETYVRACRVSRTATYYGKYNKSIGTTFTTSFIDKIGANTRLPVTDWLMLYWHHTLQKTYTHTTRKIELRIKIANFAGRRGSLPGQPTVAEVSSWKRANAIYPVEFHHREDRSNNMYRPIKVAGIKIYKAIYAGLSASGIVHEYSHSLGLGDDYPPKSKRPKYTKNCDQLSGAQSSQYNYVMCDSSYRPQSIKSAYLWIITQRYALGTTPSGSGTPPCTADSHCRGDEYCKKRVGRANICVARKQICYSCTANRQCISGAVCNNKPLGRCIRRGVLSKGQSCCQNAQCRSGKCRRKRCK